MQRLGGVRQRVPLGEQEARKDFAREESSGQHALLPARRWTDGVPSVRTKRRRRGGAVRTLSGQRRMVRWRRRRGALLDFARRRPGVVGGTAYAERKRRLRYRCVSSADVLSFARCSFVLSCRVSKRLPGRTKVVGQLSKTETLGFLAGEQSNTPLRPTDPAPFFNTTNSRCAGRQSLLPIHGQCSKETSFFPPSSLRAGSVTAARRLKSHGSWRPLGAYLAALSYVTRRQWHSSGGRGEAQECQLDGLRVYFDSTAALTT